MMSILNNRTKVPLQVRFSAMWMCYDGFKGFQRVSKGQGVFAKMLMEYGIKVVDVEDFIAEKEDSVCMRI
jgi:hypothetical protein